MAPLSPPGFEMLPLDFAVSGMDATPSLHLGLPMRPLVTQRGGATWVGLGNGVKQGEGCHPRGRLGAVWVHSALTGMRATPATSSTQILNPEVAGQVCASQPVCFPGSTVQKFPVGVLEAGRLVWSLVM